MLVGVYGAALAPASLYRQVGQGMALGFGRENLGVFEFVGYGLLFLITFCVVGVIIWRTYPMTRLSRHFGMENVLGAVIGAIWGIMFLIALLTVLRFYAVVPWT